MKIYTNYTSAAEYLEYRYNPVAASVHTLTDCWFLNGENSSYKVRFIYEQIADEFKITPIINKQECHDLRQDSLYGHWDTLLVKIFGIRFVCERAASSFIIKFKDGFDITEFRVNKESAENANPGLISSSYAVGENTLINLTNKQITVIAPQSILEKVACRTSILFMLSQAYIRKMQYALDDLITLGKKKMSYKDKYIRKEKTLDQLFQEILEFKIKYILTRPVKNNRVEDTARIWNTLYDFYNIRQYLDDLDSKMKDLKALQDNKGMEKLTTINNRIAFFAAAATVVGIIISYMLAA